MRRPRTVRAPGPGRGPGPVLALFSVVLLGLASLSGCRDDDGEAVNPRTQQPAPAATPVPTASPEPPPSPTPSATPTP